MIKVGTLIFGAIVLTVFLGIWSVIAPTVEMPNFSFLYNYIFPAYHMLGDIVIVGTMVAILSWIVIFEFFMFILKLTLRFLAWTKIFGASFLD